MSKKPKIEIGDYIVFKSATREGYPKARRKVKGFDEYGRPLVGYFGWSSFIVQISEVISVEKPEPEIASCGNCGNTDNDGSDICPDCGGGMG